MALELLDPVHVQTVGKDHQLFARVFAARGPPADRRLGPCHRIAGVDADSGPACQPIGRIPQEPFGAIGIGQDDAQVAVMFFVPVRQHLIGGLCKLFIAVCQRGIDHRQFMGIGADGLCLAPIGDQAVRRAGELAAKPFHQGLHAPILPEKGMPPPRSEISQPQPVKLAQPFYLFPKARHGAGVEHLQLEPAHVLQCRAGAQFHQGGQGGNLPQHDLWPLAFEGQVVLAIAFFQVVGRQLKILEPLHEIGPEHLALAVEGVAAQPGGFAARQAQRADMIQLFAQLSFVDQVRKADGCRPVDQREGNVGVGLVAENRLTHQQLVKVRIDQRPNDRVDLPFVVVHPCGNIDHLSPPASRRRRASGGAPRPAIRSDRSRALPPPAR